LYQFIHWNWNNEKFTAYEEADIEFTYNHQNGRVTKRRMTPLVLNGAARTEVIVPIDVVHFSIEAKYSSSKTYRTIVKMDKIETVRNSLYLEYMFKG